MTDRLARDDLVTVAQAATILGMSESGTFKLLDRGVLTRLHDNRGRRHDGVVARSEVEQVADQRAAAVAERERRRAEPRQPVTPQTPDADHHDWLTADQVGDLLGMTGQGVRARCKTGKMPHRKVGRFFWIRADHARLVANVMATDPDHLPVAVDGLS